MPLITIRHTNPAKALLAANPFMSHEDYIVMDIVKPKDKEHYIINIFGAKK